MHKSAAIERRLRRHLVRPHSLQLRCQRRQCHLASASRDDEKSHADFRQPAVLALHDGNQERAWTNLLAATRLVTAWETEPLEVSQLVRFGNTALAFNVTWQALQTNGWADEQLARLQREWESVDFFTNLPETAAFKRASMAAACQQDRQGLRDPRPTFAEFFNMRASLPCLTSGLNSIIAGTSASYLKHGSYEDETNPVGFLSRPRTRTPQGHTSSQLGQPCASFRA